MNKVAIITGAGTGIGQATAIRLAKEGYQVAVGYSSSKTGAEQTLAQISADGGIAKAFAVDISCEDSVQSLFASVLSEFKRVDLLINNAGIGHGGKLKDISMADYDALFAVNSRGTFMMCREAARCIEAGGSIINISTSMTIDCMVGQALYTASKLAMEGYSKVLAKELGKKQISVNIVSPGMTDTPLLEGGGDAEGLKKLGAKSAAMGRCGEPEDIAAAIAAFVSPDCRWITGQNLRVNGGSSII